VIALDPESLRKATGCTPEASQIFAGPLSDACVLWSINTPARVAAFVGQVAYESAKFAHLEENLDYRTAGQLQRMWPTRFRLPVDTDEATLERFADGMRNPYRYTSNPERLAEYVYGGRLGNREEGMGDGWRYIGRGPIQTTGARNYALYQAARRVDVLTFPDLLKEPSIGCDAAGFFWSRNGLNELADVGDDLGITRRITGGVTGWQVPDRVALSDRRELVESAREVYA
jgi:putative chitinase